MLETDEKQIISEEPQSYWGFEDLSTGDWSHDVEAYDDDPAPLQRVDWIRYHIITCYIIAHYADIRTNEKTTKRSRGRPLSAPKQTSPKSRPILRHNYMEADI